LDCKVQSFSLCSFRSISLDDARAAATMGREGCIEAEMVPAINRSIAVCQSSQVQQLAGVASQPLLLIGHIGSEDDAVENRPLLNVARTLCGFERGQSPQVDWRVCLLSTSHYFLVAPSRIHFQGVNVATQFRGIDRWQVERDETIVE